MPAAAIAVEEKGKPAFVDEFKSGYKGYETWGTKIAVVDYTHPLGHKERICDISLFPNLPRHPLLVKLAAHDGEIGAPPVEDVVVRVFNSSARGQLSAVGRPAAYAISQNTYQMAADYIRYRDMGARLPKFTKWAAGMFKDDATLAKDLAAAGKIEDRSGGKLIVSVDPYDIARASNAGSAHSCFKAGGAWQYMPRWFIEHCPGVAVALTLDDKGKVLSRTWLYVVRNIETGELGITGYVNAYGGNAEGVKQKVAAAGVKWVERNMYSHTSAPNPKWEFVDCLPHACHNDVSTWFKF